MQLHYSLYQRPERRLYREHKYITLVMNELDHKIGKTDFRDSQQVQEIASDLNNLVNLLGFHAKHEDEKIHGLLKKHNSTAFQDVEADHQNHEAVFNALKVKLAAITEMHSDREKIEGGYHFYLSYRQFIGENLEHLHKEETLLMPELARLCSKEELESIDYPVYQAMTAEEIVGMLQTLFAVLNPDDKEYFISDIADAVPNKLIEKWAAIATLLTAAEIADLATRVELIKQLSAKQNEHLSLAD
ncbi:hemerythrin domain-containing protein [Legionella tunisiensis]|uniref:hemerythrin domain-containing protein n=1 Tax=Legionella tunisiensis TaxID=1034944 RepID=UPI0002F6C2DB|nr:hemerythrin domain-containing protein [Legionella tunisiensis]